MHLKVRYKLIQGGRYTGLPALWISPGGWEASKEQLLEELPALFERTNMKFPITVFDISEELFDPLDIADIIEVVAALISKDLVIHCFRIESIQSFIRLGGYCIASFRDGDDLTGADKANELRWFSDGKDEPILPESTKRIPKYLIPTSARTGLDFLFACKDFWGVILPSKTVEIVFYE